ncbi:MAG: mycofactocin-coupled SDR family oxidoreductase [Acidimicrobiales bacterium]|jgi:SDR family mycofactocin-dependent oxidoreductase
MTTTHPAPAPDAVPGAAAPAGAEAASSVGPAFAGTPAQPAAAVVGMRAAEGGGRVAVVTGAARGIGAEVARGLSRAGWRLLLVDSCADDSAVDYRLAAPAELEALVEECGPNALGHVADVRDQDGLTAAVARATERFGGLDAAVAVAGVIGGGRPAWETGDALWEAMLGVNLAGVWRLARAAVPAMLQRPAPRQGRFVAVASAGAVVGLPLLSAYVAAKHGVIGLIRSLAAELGPEGITANVVAPGSTRTAALTASAALYGLASPEEFSVHHLEPRLLEPEEVAAAVVWLCGASASGVTGAVLPVDAGMTAR